MTIGIGIFSSVALLLIIETTSLDIQNFGYFDSGFSLSKFVNPDYQYIPPIIFGKGEVTGPVKLVFENGTSVTKSLSFNTATKLVFQTTALSAQNPITVYANVTFTNSSRINLENTYYMFFPFSQDISKKRDKFEETQGIIILSKSGDTQYSGTGKIMYPFEGPKPVFDILTYDEIQKYQDGDIAFLSGISLVKEINGFEFLNIEASSNTTILRTNVIIIALTFILIAFGLVQIRKDIS